MQTLRLAVAPLLFVLIPCPALWAAVPKVHTVTLGAVKRVPYTPPEATPDNKSEEATTLRVRGLFVDDRQKEWTVGEMHEVTDRSFVIRRALRINDALPSEAARWTWQPGPWLQVDRVTGHILALHLPAYDPDISNVMWFRDYAAYCGVATTGKGGLVAVVAELGSRKAVVQKVIGPWPMANPPHPVCAAAKWQRTPMRVTFDLTEGESMTLDVLGSSSFIEEGEDSEQ
jgi:hypothetical protein